MANNTFEAAYMKLKNGMTLFFQDSGARDLIKKLQTAVSLIHEIPPGGTTDQVLKKASNADYDVEWEDESGGGGGPTNTWYATCGTSSDVGSKTAVSATGDFVLATGAMVRVLFSSSNTAANPTISIDGSTAKNIRPTSGASGMDYMWKAGEVIDLVYDGSNFVMTKGGKADTSFYGITKLDSSTNSTATNVAATPKAVKDVKDMIPAASSATPQDLGTAAAGSSADYSRADHVHNKPTYTKGDVGLGNVDNVQQYSASNPPPYPVTSVNGQTGAAVLTASDVGALSDTYVAPVTSVNGQTGDVVVSSGLAFDDVYPVGSIYMSVNSTDPGSLFGGTWEQIQDRFLLAAGTTYANGATGGEATHTLTKNEMPSHTHGSKTLVGTMNPLAWSSSASESGIVSGVQQHIDRVGNSGSNWGDRRYTINATHEHDSVGNGQAHNNMPPYLVVYMWERTA